MQDLINAILSATADERKKYHLTLGQLIEFLKDKNPDAEVRYDIGGYPDTAHSYRGYYSDLAFGISERPITAAALLREAKQAIGEEFEGYKGGMYRMDADTPLWRGDYGNCGPAIVGVRQDGEAIVLITKEVD